MKTRTILAFAAIAAGSVASASPIRILARGHVGSTSITSGTLSSVVVNDPVVWRFSVDTNTFVDGNPGVYPNTRGFPATANCGYSLMIGGIPVPAGVSATPMVVLTNGFPVADYIMIANNTNIGGSHAVPVSIGLPSASTGLDVTYNGNGSPSLPSKNIQDAVRVWAYSNISVFGWTLGASGNGQMFINYDSLAITCPADLDDGTGTGVSDGGVDVSDLLYFLSAFEAGSTAADVDNGTESGCPDNGVDISDLLFFLAHFEGGC